MILIDSNVLIDIFDRDPTWFDWSLANIQQAATGASLFVTPVIVGEVAPRFATLNEFSQVMAGLLIAVEPMSAEAGYHAGVAFQQYRTRRKEGAAKTILADFLIGGQARSMRAGILTRDPRFYRTYFPELTLITPENEHG